MVKISVKKKAKLAAAKRKVEETVLPPSNPFELKEADPRRPNVPTAEDFETKSIISYKALHGVTKTKKEKLKLRKKLWQDKIEICKEKSSKKSKKNKSGRSQVLNGEKSFQLLLDSLPSVKDKITELKGNNVTKQNNMGREQNSESTAKNGPKTKTEKQRQREMTRNMETFRQVLQHPEYQKTPFDTMIEHLKNKQEMERNGQLVEETTKPIKKSRNRRRKMKKRSEDMES